MADEAERPAPQARNDRLQGLLDRLATSLETAARPPREGPELPALFILGPPRTGSTYCLQWLAASGAFTYPSNFIARFWTAPFVGALAQDMLTDPVYDYQGELADVVPRPIGGSSEVGKTKGLLSPSEFWFFWRHHLPGDGDVGVDLLQATPEQFAAFRDDVARFADVRKRPAAMKGKIVNHQIVTFAEAFERALFLYMDRDPIDVAWSLLQARRRKYGDEGKWLSFKTPDHAALSKLEPTEQVMGQVQSVRRDVARGLASLPAHRWLRLDYLELCRDPDRAFSRVAGLFEANGTPLEGANTMPATLPSMRQMPPEKLARLEEALAQFPE